VVTQAVESALPFTGQEDFLIDQAFEQVLHHWLGEKPDALSLDRWMPKPTPLKKSSK